MSKHRIFRRKDGSVYTSRHLDQIDAPGSRLGVIVDDDQWMRLVQRAYRLGRKDHAADMRALLHEVE